jgi:hypothetical protein
MQQCGSTQEAPAVPGGVVEWEGVGKTVAVITVVVRVMCRCGQVRAKGQSSRLAAKTTRMLSELA